MTTLTTGVMTGKRRVTRAMMPINNPLYIKYMLGQLYNRKLKIWKK
jgi:hypothetical protein